MQRNPEKKKKSGSRSQPESAPSSAERPAKVKKVYAVIDYPLEGEIIVSPEYTFRVGASPADQVEVAIDAKQWQACRPAAGYWWFDWSGYQAGPHVIQARLKSGNRYLKSAVRSLTVLI